MRSNCKHMFRRAGSAILALILLVAVAAGGMVPALADGDGVVVKLHYDRPDGEYDDWDVWAWADGKDGAGYPFAEEDGQMVATIPLPAGVTKLGFIVRQGGSGWAAKDVNADQFIELPDVTAGTVHIYVKSGVEGYTREDGDDVVTGVLVSGAQYDADAGTVTVTTTGAVDGEPADVFQVCAADGTAVSVASAEQAGDTEYILTLGEELDDVQTYQLVYDGTEYRITMPSVFSTESFEQEYTYTGDDLGAVWTEEKTTFRVWAPTAQSVSVNLYTGGAAGEDDLIEQLPMQADANGTWVAEKEGDLNGTYYTYSVEVAGQVNEACDPYARTTGVGADLQRRDHL